MRTFLGFMILSAVILNTAAPTPAQPPEREIHPTIGVLVGSAERSAGISLGPADDDANDVIGSVIGGTVRDLRLGTDDSSWSAVITTSGGEFEVNAWVTETEGRHAFTYEVTNLSLDGGQTFQLLSLAVPLGGNVRPSDVAASTGWIGQGNGGSLGGFFVFQSQDEQGIGIGETATFEFALPALPALGGEETGQKELPLPPGVFLGADLRASRMETPTVITGKEFGELPKLDPNEMCREGLVGVAYIELPDGRGVCIWGAIAIDPNAGADLHLAIRTSGQSPESPLRPLESPNDDLLVAVPLRAGQKAQSSTPLPEGWKFEAPGRPERNPGFAVFEGTPRLPGDDSTSLTMTYDIDPVDRIWAMVADGRFTSIEPTLGDGCTVEAKTMPGNMDYQIAVRHSFSYGQGQGHHESWFYHDGTSPESGEISVEWPHMIECTGPGGRVDNEQMVFYLTVLSSTSHDAKIVHECFVYFEVDDGVVYKRGDCPCE